MIDSYLMTGRRGSTLLETLICASLLALTLGLMAPLLGRTSRVVNRSDRDATSQQQALVAVQKLFSEAAYTNPRSLRLDGADPTACAFLSQRPTRHPACPTMGAGDFIKIGLFTPDLAWKKMLVIYYRSAQQTLNYREFSYTDAQQQLARVNRNSLQTLIYRADTPMVTVATGVTSFLLESSQEGMLHTTITTEKSWDKKFQCTLDLVIAMRNP